jgi:hypothetical protein
MENKKDCKKISTVHLYRASPDKWNYKDFHDPCDGKGPTITLFKVKDNGRRCGGYTSISWD